MGWDQVTLFSICEQTDLIGTSCFKVSNTLSGRWKLGVFNTDIASSTEEFGMTVSRAESTQNQADRLSLHLLLARIGAALYVGWGVLHLIAARGIYELASSIPDGLARARLEQSGLDLGLFAVQAMAVAVLLNWRNDRIGYWLNIIVVGAVDLGYVVLVIVPGYVPASLIAFAGPVIYVIGAMFSTAGLLRRNLTISNR
jgi:hypothetical protein